MAFIFEELDSQETPLGPISLRRRAEPRLGGEVLYEVKLGDEFLMSSLFTEAEIQLSKLGIQALKNNGHQENLNIVVGGLGLGYTALAVLEEPSVKNLQVIELMPAVIEWHQQGILPMGDALAVDPRCTLVQDDFFDRAVADRGFGAEPSEQVHAVFLDIDHSPSFWLDPNNSSFYTADSLDLLRKKLLPGGVFGLWSDELPDDAFTQILSSVFAIVDTEIVSFSNPLSGGKSTNSVYLAYRAK